MDIEARTEIEGGVGICGAKTLTQFTDGILKRGFAEVAQSKGAHHDYGADIYQIHGAPQSEEDDRVILERIKQDLKKQDNIKRVVLLHRPDEIELRYPEFKDTLAGATRPFGITFLGDMHIDDDFFNVPNALRRVIPHGFFENISHELQVSPIIVGSHTTWGEMRSTGHMIQLLGEVFRQRGTHDIIGYVGGKPKDQLDSKLLREKWDEHNGDVSVVFMDAHYKQNLEDNKGENVVLLDLENTMPDNFGLTYNVQLYYLNDRVRTGESSGSAHSAISIPVVLEMNGSEAIEDLRVVKVPYGSRDDIGTVDFRAGAESILKSVEDRSYIHMLEHNLEQSKKFTPSYVASEYIKLFDELK